MALLSLPPLDFVTVFVTSAQLFLCFTQYTMESKPGMQTPYSKFFDEKKSKTVLVSGRVGMLVIYLPATLFCAVVIQRNVDESNFFNRELLVGLLLFAHFAKRDAEVLFLHKYSKKMDLMSGASIAVYYTLVCFIITHFQKHVPAAATTPFTLATLIVGVGLFAVGQMGNFYHHWLLANLRNPRSAKKDEDAAMTTGDNNYKIPSAGLFALVTMPHYFFELLSWLGVAVVSTSLTAFLVVANMSSYLAGRSVATQKWYFDNFKGYPRDRKAIIPFIL